MPPPAVVALLPDTVEELIVSVPSSTSIPPPGPDLEASPFVTWRPEIVTVPPWTKNTPLPRNAPENTLAVEAPAPAMVSELRDEALKETWGSS